MLSLRHLPVLDGHGRGLEIPPKRKVSVVKILDGLGVCDHSFFFKVPDEAVADAWGEEIGEEECAEEDALGSEDHCPHLPAWLGEFEEGQEVHALVVCFFEESLDPAKNQLQLRSSQAKIEEMRESLPSVIPLHPPDALEVSEHTGYHPGYTGNTFKEDKPCDPFLLCHWIIVRSRDWICAVPGDKVHAPTEKADGSKG